MLSNVKRLKNGGMTYCNVRIEEIPSEKFPSMVQIVKGPLRLRSVLSKKFISLEKAVLAIDLAVAESLIGSEKMKVRMEMVENGVISITEI